MLATFFIKPKALFWHEYLVSIEIVANTIYWHLQFCLFLQVTQYWCEHQKSSFQEHPIPNDALPIVKNQAANESETSYKWRYWKLHCPSHPMKDSSGKTRRNWTRVFNNSIRIISAKVLPDHFHSAFHLLFKVMEALKGKVPFLFHSPKDIHIMNTKSNNKD